jgi:GT2 family glycosyltransferase
LSNPLTISVILPTKNRYHILPLALKSILQQIDHIDELIIVDQSDKPSISHTDPLFHTLESSTSFRFHYDPSVNGLVAAKHRGVQLATSELIAFLEDDIELLPNYFTEIKANLNLYPHIVGLSGVVANPPYNRLYAALHTLTHRGPFRDPRPLIFTTKTSINTSQVYSSPCLSGGIFCWRKEVFTNVEFDLLNHFHYLEDVEYSSRVADYYGDALLICTSIRLYHYPTAPNREHVKTRYFNVVREYALFFLKRQKTPYAKVSFAILILSLFLSALTTSFTTRSALALSGFFTALMTSFSVKSSISMLDR